MNILVTGGAGFIGKHLVDFLLKKDFRVTILDNFSNSTKESISPFIKRGVKIIDGDIRNLPDIVNASKNQDLIIHLAAKISVFESIENPLETFQVNVDGTRNVLAACKKNQIKKLIVSSSAAVYRDGLPDVKLTEESEINPISPYGESKVKMEQTINEFASKHEINYVILRFFNIYGIGQSSEYAGVITKFMEKIKQGKPLEIFGDGMQTRDFVAVQDVVRSIDNAISSEKSGIYNIASGKGISVKDLAELIISLSGKNLDIQYTAGKKGDIIFSEADISSAKDDLGYYSKVELKEGINNVLAILS
jgi:UDP-glucose 4-epimerase